MGIFSDSDCRKSEVMVQCKTLNNGLCEILGEEIAESPSCKDVLEILLIGLDLLSCTLDCYVDSSLIT